MHIIYHCVGGTHSSAIASAIHLGLISRNHPPTMKDILSVSYFDTLTKEDQGKILYRGKDSNSNKIYTLSRQFVPHLVLPALKNAWELAGGKKEDLLLVNTMPSVNLLMKIGGLSSRRLGLVSFGRPLVAKGAVKSFKILVEIVNNTENIANG